MPYPRQHYYLTWGGTLCQDEIWQNGCHFVPNQTATINKAAFDEISLPDIFDDISTWFVSGPAHLGPASGIGAQAHLNWVRLAAKDVDGHDIWESRVHYAQAPSIPVPTSTHAPQVTYVVTLWSGENLRRANYGRFYVPMPISAWDYVNGRMDQPYCDNLATAAKNMLHAIEGEVDTAITPAQLGLISKVGAGEWKPVAKIAVGRVLDTQRRRRNKLDEAPVYQGY